MDYQFEKFEGRNHRLEDRITVTKSNSIGFPQKFYEDNGIKNKKYVVLYWDKANKAIGIHFVKDTEEKSKFSILHSKKGYGGSVVVRSFFKSNNINLTDYAGRYEFKKVRVDGVGELYVIELKSKQERKDSL